MEWYTFVGYAGSVLVALSLSMKNVLKLRWINLFGASTFSMYGLLLGAYPVFLLNGYITIIDVFFLYGIYKKKDCFSLVPVLSDSHLYLKKFIDFYKDDIRKFVPEFSVENLNNPKFFFILRNLIPAGLFVYEEISDSEIEIKLDYAIPAYRDTKNGKYVYFAQNNFLKKKGYNKLLAYGTVKAHKRYLLNVGYKKDVNRENYFLKFLD